MKLRIVLAGALALATNAAMPARAETPAMSFDGDYNGSLSGGFSGSMKFKIFGGGKISGEGKGTLDGRAFEGKLGGTIGGAPDYAINATLDGTLAAKPETGGGGASGTFPAAPFNGLQVTYSVSGIKAGAFQDSEGFTHSRFYQVDGATGPVTVSGSGVPHEAVCNSEYGSFWFQTDATLTVGGSKPQEFHSPPPCDRKDAKAMYKVSQPAAQFQLSLPAPTGGDASVGFSVSQTYVNPRFGNRGVVVSGGKAKIGDERISLALTGKLKELPKRKNPRATFVGTYAGKTHDKEVKGDWTASGKACSGPRRPDGSCPSGGEVQACPSKEGGYAATGLIAAADGARAVLRYRGTPGAKVRIDYKGEGGGGRIEDTVMDFKMAKLPMERVEVSYASDLPAEFTVGDNGELKTLLFFRAINNMYKPNQAISEPLRIKLTFTEAEDSDSPSSAEVMVGLGVGIEVQKMLSVSTSRDDPGPHHAWRAYVQSRFHPGLDLGVYVDNIKTCESSEVTIPIVNVQSVWLNQDDKGDPVMDGIGGRGVLGTVNAGTDDWMSAGQRAGLLKSKVSGKTYLGFPYGLRGSDTPVYSQQGDVLPGVTQLRDGHFIKAYWAYLEMGPSNAWDGPKFLGSAGTAEPRVLDHEVMVFSWDEPERWYTSASCMFQPQDSFQLAWLLWARMIPAFGEGLGKFEYVMDSLCTMARGDIRGGLSNLLKEVGKDQFTDAIKNAIIPKVSYNLVKGAAPPEVYRLVGVDPADPRRMSQAFTKWKELMLAETEAVLAQVDKSDWQPPPASAGFPTSPPKTSDAPPPPVKYPGPSRPAPRQWDSIGGGDGGTSGSSPYAPSRPSWGSSGGGSGAITQ